MTATLHSAYQHTRCWQALTVIKASLDQYNNRNTSQLDKHVDKINCWLEACETDIRKKEPSAGAKRATKTACERMEEYILLDGLTGDALFMRWAASIWAGLTILEDCRNTCPVWFQGKNWRYLLQTFNTLAMHLYQLDENIAETGTTIYDQIAT